MQIPPALQALVDGLNAGLAAHIRPDTGLQDPLDARPSPPDHYGQVCAALALACSGAQAWTRGRPALQAWLNLPPERLGHLPFNRLALLLLQRVLDAHGTGDSERTAIAAGLQRCTLRGHYPSNNWTLLAQTCRLLEAPPPERAREARRMAALLERWTTRKGGFIDFPARPDRRFSTPLAYHHKALFLAALANHVCDDAALRRHAHRLLGWLVHCWDPAGYAGGFGRSTHALFGDGCLIAALVLLGVDARTDGDPLTALATRLQRQRRADGLLWLNPAGPESAAASWDSYMHLSVYNAWAAAMIGAALFLRRSADPADAAGSAAPPACTWRAAAPGWFHDEEAGIGCARLPTGFTVLVSTHGQPPQAYSQNEADFRYAGGRLLHLSHPALPPLQPPPLRVTRQALQDQPVLAGPTPLFAAHGELYALTRFHQVQVRAEGGTLHIELEGQAEPVFRPRPTSPWQRAVSALDWRLLGGRLGRQAALRSTTLPGLTGRLALTLSTADAPPTARLDTVLELTVGDDLALTYLNPGAISTATTHPDRVSSQAAPLPSSLPGGHARCGAPETLPAGRSRWTSAVRFPDTPAQHPLPVSHES